MLNDRQIKSFIKKAQKQHEKKAATREQLQKTIVTTDVVDISSDIFNEMKKVPHTT